jgi:hypothetical protein
MLPVMTSGSADETPLTDALGRRRSPVAVPGYKRRKPPPNKGRKLPAEELTPQEVDDLMNAASNRKPQEARDHAMFWLMYRADLKVRQIVDLQRRHFEPGSDRLVVPAGAKGVERTIVLDSISRRLLDEWFDTRRRLKVGNMAPLFCGVQAHVLGRPMEPSTVRNVLRGRAERAGIDRRVSPEGLRKSGRAHSVGRAMAVEGRIEAYLDEVAFKTGYPAAYDKWRDAQDLYVLGPERHGTRIGHDCREALMLFADTLAEREGVRLDVPASHTVARLRAVIAVMAPRLGDRTAAVLDALVVYWGTVSDLAQRQVHGAAKEGQPLTSEDARRVVFQTLLVMYEVDRAIRYGRR